MRRLLLLLVLSAGLLPAVALTLSVGSRQELLHAFAEAEAAAADDTVTILIAPGVYWLDDPDDEAVRRSPSGTPFAVELRCSHLRLVGQGQTAADVVLACNRGQRQGAVGNYTMMHIVGDDVEARHLTFGNYCNVDLVYPADSTQNRARRSTSITQSQLVLCQGTGYRLEDCRFVSRLNACPFVGGRATVFTRCYIECGDDALDGAARYDRCEIHFTSSKPIYHASGATFCDCDLYLHGGHQHLTKQGGRVNLVGCRLHGPDGTRLSWSANAAGCPLCYVADTDGARASGLLDDEHTVDITGTALHRVLAAGPQPSDAVTLLERTHQRRPDGDPDAQPIEYRVEPVAANAAGETVPFDFRDAVWTADDPHGIFSFEPQDDGTLLLTPHLEGDSARSATFRLVTPYGLCLTKTIRLKPSELPAPTFRRRPVLRRHGDTLTVRYALDLQGRADQSVITWYRSADRAGKSAVPVAVSRDDEPQRSYTLQPGDEGHYLSVQVKPKHLRSVVHDRGTYPVVRTRHRVHLTDTAAVRHLATDFRTMPTWTQTALLPGYWTMDAYKPADVQQYQWPVERAANRPCWGWEEGYDGAEGWGFVQVRRGARLRYTPTEGQRGAMTATLVVHPYKPAGQGFGSATGQYMDVCIHFDGATLTGYGLRIERTPRCDRFVEMSLVRYDHGTVIPLTEPVPTSSYVSPCTLTVAYADGLLTATATSPRAAAPFTRTEQGVAFQVEPAVTLTAPVGAPAAYGFHVQHTGSTGASATMFKSLTLDWR